MYPTIWLVGARWLLHLYCKWLCCLQSQTLYTWHISRFAIFDSWSHQHPNWTWHVPKDPNNYLWSRIFSITRSMWADNSTPWLSTLPQWHTWLCEQDIGTHCTGCCFHPCSSRLHCSHHHCGHHVWYNVDIGVQWMHCYPRHGIVENVSVQYNLTAQRISIYLACWYM